MDDVDINISLGVTQVNQYRKINTQLNTLNKNQSALERKTNE
jgi:hypothetical protein